MGLGRVQLITRSAAFLAAFFLSTALDARRLNPATSVPPPPGKLVDIGARKLHLYSTGSGGPAVIVENGGGAFSIDWALVQPKVSEFTEICTYDRAG